MTMEFKKLDEYLAQHREIAKKGAELSRAAACALEAHQAAKAEYEATMRRGLVEGIDVSSELDRLDEKVSDTLKQYERKKRESQTFTTLDKSHAISRDDVWKAWNDEFIPEYKKTTFDPILEKLLEAKRIYLQAAKEYHDAAKEIDDMRYDINSALGDGYYYKLHPVRIGRRDVLEHYLITENIANDVYSGSFSNSEIQKLLKGGDK